MSNPMDGEHCVRSRVVIDGENFYLVVGKNFVDATVPRENSNDRAKLRKIVKVLCDEITRSLGGEVLDDDGGDK